MLEQLHMVYGSKMGELLREKINARISTYKTTHSVRKSKWLSEKDAVLITYGDQFKEDNEAPLHTLRKFLNRHLKDSFSSVHILPFYPYSSDDGFSVIDYRRVDPSLGDWSDIEALSQDYRLMFDAVVNHVSSQSNWFKKYLAGDPQYSDFFIERDFQKNYSNVARPRSSSLFSQYETHLGTKHLWTTFSSDQIDLNYKSSKVFLEIVDVLLFYISRGAQIIRMDAVPYIWKKPGTSCVNLRKTHAVVQIFRSIVDSVAPGTILITESNVPHRDNITYFGDGYNEAQLIYQFALPPLTLHAFYRGSSHYLSQWAKSLETPSPNTTFFNFMASHDGIGLMPAKELLPESEIQHIVNECMRRGGEISYRDNGDRTKSPYELNITWYSALSIPQENQKLSVKRFIASQAILLCLQGVPGIYIHSLFGSANDTSSLSNSNHLRSINRKKFQLGDLEALLEDSSSTESQIFTQYVSMLNVRRQERAFHPNSSQRIVELNDSLFTVLRDNVLCITNITSQSRNAVLDLEHIGLAQMTSAVDLITQNVHENHDETMEIPLGAYQVLWLKFF
ncbi:sugar phosphorylase [Alicyclobacillus sp. SO9]|uniref:sugar phosphorylase n=1 Tax=Alicyclobacillus sp. SO9 TaxID=2665646 RepID=UPI0018E8F598|nr:sugar phosphorylase [Alicyclobacillus sp. SO9]QQE79672.1 sugar phosphorylase [Alicyclobacillus sp. SO9]